MYEFDIVYKNNSVKMILDADWEEYATPKFIGNQKVIIEELRYWFESKSGPFGHSITLSDCLPADIYFALFYSGPKDGIKFHVIGEIKKFTTPQGEVL